MRLGVWAESADMQSVVDERFREEVRRFSLRFTCESCVHFEPEAESCSNGYPTEPHRRIRLASVSRLAFCKMFELC